ncbi:MAG: regulatory protein RecX [Myxococcota bacterium]
MRKPTERSLANVALLHLRRHSASVKQLERMLLRRVRKAEREFGEPFDLSPAIARIVARFVGAGYLDDRRLAVARTGSLRRAGRSTRAIRQKLRAKGLASALVDEVTKAGDGDELAAAFVLARKKRLGPYRRAAVDREGRAKELALLARAGFSFGVAKRVVDASADDAQRTVPT